MNERRRMVVAMSGGVDSSVAAGLLKEQGFDLIGVTLHLWDAEGPQRVGRCCSAEDQEDARRVCDFLGIPHYVLDERAAFKENVVDPFVESYERGSTPSPCVHCNRTVKLAHLVNLASTLGASHVATGHYARVIQGEDGEYRLLRGLDSLKDQSYFLFGVPRADLAKLCFPLGSMNKDEARTHARRLGLPNADKPDSQELCFVPDGNVTDFIRRRTGHKKNGHVIDEEGQVLAHHEGVEGFTVGQRRGLGVSGSAHPRFVLRILPESQDVVVGPESRLWGTSLHASQVTWIQSRPLDAFRAQVRIRYRHEAAFGTVRPTTGGFLVEFENPQRAITPGQAAVVYVGDEVVAGGFIATAESSEC